MTVTVKKNELDQPSNPQLFGFSRQGKFLGAKLY